MSKIARIPVSSGPKGVPGLVRWVRRTYPNIYQGLAVSLSTHPGLQGAVSELGTPMTALSLDSIPVKAADSGGAGIASTILNTVSELAKVALPLYQQQKLFDMQVKRAAAGQPMLNTDQLANMSSVKVGVDESTRNTGLMIAGAAVLGLLAFKLLR